MLALGKIMTSALLSFGLTQGARINYVEASRSLIVTKKSAKSYFPDKSKTMEYTGLGLGLEYNFWANSLTCPFAENNEISPGRYYEVNLGLAIGVGVNLGFLWGPSGFCTNQGWGLGMGGVLTAGVMNMQEKNGDSHFCG